jgi:hypothetical protein
VKVESLDQLVLTVHSITDELRTCDVDVVEGLANVR